MLALVKSTPDWTEVVAFSEDREKLRARLKEEATEYAMNMCGYDESEFAFIFKKGIKMAKDSWEDIDDDISAPYSYKLEILEAEVI